MRYFPTTGNQPIGALYIDSEGELENDKEILRDFGVCSFSGFVICDKLQRIKNNR